ncbi:MAG: hypothetical protein KAV70_04275 [Bacteroidales bacterium]|nr:hypothetical protein [Bacteroidales bacterium]
MKYKNKSLLFWILSIIFMLTVAIYQKTTGPTYPVIGIINIEKQSIKYKLLRSYGGADDAKIKIEIPDTSVNGVFKYKRFKSFDEWTEKIMIREGENLVAFIPHQPPAGKVMYEISINKNGKIYKLTDKPVIIRFKGHVPLYILLPHIFFMFIAMVFSIRTGLEVIIKGKNAYNYTLITTICLFIGGLILGPIVQKFAFDAFWTGWPWGHDLTDNKTIVAFIFWLIALIRLIKNKEKSGWALVASIVLLVIYLIPHSVLGSEIDYTQVVE